MTSTAVEATRTRAGVKVAVNSGPVGPRLRAGPADFRAEIRSLSGGADWMRNLVEASCCAGLRPISSLRAV